MTTSTKGLFAFLAGFALVATILGYEGIDRLHRAHFPPFSEDLFSGYSVIPSPPDKVILCLDSTVGRVLVWCLALAIPAGCVLLAFGYQRCFLGLSLLMLHAAVFGWVGLSLFLHGLFDAPPL